MPRQDHELSVPELLAKIDKLVGLVRLKTYGRGFEEGRQFERGESDEEWLARQVTEVGSE